MLGGTSVCLKNPKIELNIKDKIRLIGRTSQKNKELRKIKQNIK